MNGLMMEPCLVRLSQIWKSSYQKRTELAWTNGLERNISVIRFSSSRLRM